MILTIAFLATFSGIDMKFPTGLGPSGFAVGETIRMWANQGFTFAMTIVAFLIAGFTVLATITKPALFAELAQIEHKNRNGRETGLTELEFIFFVFINVFVHYVSFLLLSAFIVLFGTRNGPLTMATFAIRSVTSARVFDIGVRLVFVSMGAWFISLILKLKSFIWNVYQVVLIVIVADKSDGDNGRE